MASSLCAPVQFRRQEPFEAAVDHCIVPLLSSEGAQLLVHQGALRALVGPARPSLTAICPGVAESAGGGGQAVTADPRIRPTGVGGCA